MNDLALSLGSLLVGIIASVIVSAYYFRRGLVKSLTPFLHYSSAPLRGLDEEVKRDLEITYQGKHVADFFEVQFLLANTGDKAIRDVIEPLRFHVPEGSTLLDALILYREPAELKSEVSIENDRKSFSVNFPLMNSGDFFILKVLLDGAPKAEQLRFSIVVDELPPVLKSEKLSPTAVGSSRGGAIDAKLATMGIICILLGFSGVIFALFAPQVDLVFPELLGAYKLPRAVTYILVASSFLGALLLAATGIIGFLQEVFDGRLSPKRRRFIVPENVMQSYFKSILKPHKGNF